MHLRAPKAPAPVRRAVILAVAHGVIGLAFAAIAPGLEDAFISLYGQAAAETSPGPRETLSAHG